MHDKVLFHNPWGAGDLFESRGFVKECIRIIPAKEYFYAHRQHPRTFADISILQYLPFDKLSIDSNILKINTWIGQNGLKYGCTVESNYQMYNDILGNLGKLSGTPLDYLPTIDYTKFQIQNIDIFLQQHTEDKILICNGDVLSGQAKNFDFGHSIYLLAQKYPTKLFILTRKIPIQHPRIIYTDDITRTTDGFDINEISYLSTFCRILVGRYSGPHTCSQVKQNWFDETKRLVTFTYRKLGCSFTSDPKTKMKQFWSPAIDNKGICETIIRAIES
ncbi:TPA: hypothetical protein DCQ22_04095 [Candidatus Nomurabacteria bacterium]|nr:hypothetical protein [Candidatus Nomurabacteria bacterium]